MKKPNKEEVNEFFYEQTERAYNDTLHAFRKQASLLIVEGSGWGEQVVAYETELSLQLRALINNAREKELDKFL